MAVDSVALGPGSYSPTLANSSPTTSEAMAPKAVAKAKAKAKARAAVCRRPAMSRRAAQVAESNARRDARRGAWRALNALAAEVGVHPLPNSVGAGGYSREPGCIILASGVCPSLVGGGAWPPACARRL